MLPDMTKTDNYEQAVRDTGDLCAQLATEKNDDRSGALLVEIRLTMPSGQRAELAHLIKNGPVHDGDVMSKAHIGDLLRWGLAAKVMVKGQWGYTAATYRGGHVLSDQIEVTTRCIVSQRQP